MPPPLRKTNGQGLTYSRRASVDAIIDALVAGPRDEALRRCANADRKHAEYIPSEALLHLLRGSRLDNSDKQFELLFRLLFARVRTSLKGALPSNVYANAADMWQSVEDDLVELIRTDRAEYQVGLDYYEVNFDSALAADRTDVLRKMGPRKARTVPLEDTVTGEIAGHVEEAAQKFFAQDPSKFGDEAFRSAAYAAIDTLPGDQKQVVCLLIQGLPIYDKDPTVTTVARTLNCSEKTVRNRRNRAFETLKALLKEEYES